jgi:phosphatidylinositol kinase/protein kinase (PI-3  family)
VLETLIYDPLVDWKRANKGQQQQAAGAAGAADPVPAKRTLASEEAEKDLRTVELKLLGLPHPSKIGLKKSSSALWAPIVKPTSGHGLAMTVEAHVDYLIREATSPQNLALSFVGWAPWL